AMMLLAEQLFAAGEPATPLARLRCESMVLDLLCQALRPFDPAPPRPVHDTRTLQRLYRVRDWLENASSRPVSMDELVREFGMGVDTLQRAFRQVFGTTVFAYLHEHRLQRARRMLENGTPVSVAAYAAGYGNPANFSTAFKRRFGIAPKLIRGAR
ncbi:MAG: AraC family transcriptional regulator, partial [Niabella sp.]